MGKFAYDNLPSNIKKKKHKWQNKRFAHRVRKYRYKAEKPAHKNGFFQIKSLFPSKINDEKIRENSYEFTCPKQIQTKNRKKF